MPHILALMLYFELWWPESSDLAMWEVCACNVPTRLRFGFGIRFMV